MKKLIFLALILLVSVSCATCINSEVLIEDTYIQVKDKKYQVYRYGEKTYYIYKQDCKGNTYRQRVFICI